MLITTISFKNFRNLNLETEPGEGVNLIVARNGSGKTNFLDGIHYLASSNSFKQNVDNSINIAWDAQFPFAKVAATLRSGTDSATISQVIVFSDDSGRSVKRLITNDINKSKLSFGRVLPLIAFVPKDIDIVSGSPDIRREEMDYFLSALNYEYASALREYKQLVKQRNKLLALIADKKSNASELAYWNERIALLGGYILAARENIIDQFQPALGLAAKSLFNAKLLKLDLKYETRFTGDESRKQEELFEKLNNNLVKELAAKRTLYGPHRDDYLINFDDRPIRLFGSRGEQRLAALIVKLAMWEFLRTARNEKPILLLDDVMSELDKLHRHSLEDYILGLQTQTFIAATDFSDFRDKFRELAKEIVLTKI